jgi:hypothetical protein
VFPRAGASSASSVFIIKKIWVKRVPILPLEWIEEQQNHSWQIEILISGGLIYTLYQLPVEIKRLFLLVYANTMVSDNTIALLIGAYFITQTLLIGFSVNLLLRAIWVAYLGINFSFPSRTNTAGGDADKKTNKGELLDRIISLERYSSLSYSIAIISALMAIGMLIVAMIVVPLSIFVLPQGAFQNSAFFLGYIVVYIFLFFSIMNGSLPKVKTKRKWINRAVAVIAGFFSMISLYFIYNKGWYRLTSNVKKWKIYLLQFSYLLVAILLSLNQIGDFYTVLSDLSFDPLDERQNLDLKVYQEAKYINYESMLREDNLIFKSCIQEEFIKESHIKLFMVYWVDFDRSLNHYFKTEGLDTDGRFNSFEELFKNDSIYSNCIDQLFDITIDDNARIKDLQWFNHKHPLTREEGFLTYIPTDSLPNGLHKLKIMFNNYYPSSDTTYQRLWDIIPFIKE